MEAESGWEDTENRKKLRQGLLPVLCKQGKETDSLPKSFKGECTCEC